MSEAPDRSGGEGLPTKPRIRWHRIYFLLAAFDILTVSGSFLLNHQLGEIHLESIADNRQWSRRLELYADLGTQIARVNAPGNDVFETLDVAAERERLHSAVSALSRAMAEARADVRHGVAPRDTELLLGGLTSVEAEIKQMIAEEELIFSYFEASRPDLAGSHMATMDRRFFAASTALSLIRGKVAKIQQGRLETQATESRALRRYEYLIGALILLMVCAVALYGNAIAKNARRDTLEMETAYHEANAASRAKSAFMATMSHEIRTPMNGVIGVAELLLSTRLSDEQRSYVETIRNSGDSLLTILGDILDFSKMEASKLKLQPVALDLTRAVEQVVDLLAPGATDKGLELAVAYAPTAPRFVVADPVRLHQLFGNLIGNAIKFTEQGHILVNVECLGLGEGRANFRFSVQDTGIGVAPERLAAIFDRFTQGDDSTTRRFGGTGLGLAICRQLAQLMEGEVGASNNPSGGSTFWSTFSLPIDASRHQEELSRDDLQDRAILIVDESEVTRRLLVSQTRALGMRPHSARSIEEALEQLRESRASDRPIGIVLVGWGGSEGLADRFVGVLRADPASRDLSLMIAGASSREQAENPHLAGEAICHLRKPIRMSEFAGLLEAAATRPAISLEQKSPPSAADGPASEATEELLVLLAEDNVVNEKVATKMLQLLGCRVEVAHDGIEAVEMLSARPYDLVFMDCQMPRMDGFEATRRIRDLEDAELSRTPIIALTANAMDGDREHCLRSGMDDYLSKPVSLDRFERILSRWREKLRTAASSAA